MRPTRAFLPLLLAFSVAACGGPEPQEGALTADEERQLNDAAAMLDEASEASTEPAPAK